MKKTYINPVTEVIRIKPIVMQSASITKSTTDAENGYGTGDPNSDFDAKDGGIGASNLWED